MVDTELVVVTNRKIAKNTYEMTLSGNIGDTRPGQFVNLKLEGFYLRRPISVCDYGEDRLTLIYKVVGRGTEHMAGLGEGARLDVLTGLGNGYDTSVSGERPLLIGGGAGVPPMYALAKKLISEGKNPAVILGFNAKDEVFYESEFKALGLDTYVTTADGSYGIRGFVTDAMDMLPLRGDPTSPLPLPAGAGRAERKSYSYFYTCGPEPMLRAVYDKSVTSGQFSFEERMGCGFGACMGCTCRTKYGHKRICRDGPVLTKEELPW